MVPQASKSRYGTPEGPLPRSIVASVIPVGGKASDREGQTKNSVLQWTRLLTCRIGDVPPRTFGRELHTIDFAISRMRRGELINRTTADTASD